MSGENLYSSSSPRSRLSAALEKLRLRDVDMQAVAGNSFHLAAMGTWTMYVLAHVQKHPAGLVLGPLLADVGAIHSVSENELIEEQDEPRACCDTSPRKRMKSKP